MQGSAPLVFGSLREEVDDKDHSFYLVAENQHRRLLSYSLLFLLTPDLLEKLRQLLWLLMGGAHVDCLLNQGIHCQGPLHVWCLLVPSVPKRIGSGTVVHLESRNSDQDMLRRQPPLCRLTHLEWKRRRKEQSLAIQAYHLRELIQLLFEPQCQHSVGFVQHQKRYGLQAQRGRAHQVEQSPGCRHYDMRNSFGEELIDLGLLIDPADDRERSEAEKLCEPSLAAERAANLLSQLPRRNQHQRTGAVSLARVLSLQPRTDVGYNREEVGQGLARTSGSDADEVQATEGCRPRLCLYGRGSSQLTSLRSFEVGFELRWKAWVGKRFCRSRHTCTPKLDTKPLAGGLQLFARRVRRCLASPERSPDE
mmetsp:Transcript_3169/g.9629  ORF Transcript_3169/g.9629 Transcript_3169/m.9629 type:complete len:365 (+) Transcript_3169:1192-2286(+)